MLSRSTPRCYQELFCFQLVAIHCLICKILLIFKLYRVLILKEGSSVNIVDVFLRKTSHVAKIDSFNVILNIVSHRFPVKWKLFVFVTFPPIVCQSMHGFSILSRNVEELFRDASYVDTGASKTPLRPLTARLNVVKKGHWHSQRCGFLGTCQPSRTPANHNQIVLFVYVKGKSGPLLTKETPLLGLAEDWERAGVVWIIRGRRHVVKLCDLSLGEHFREHGVVRF